MPQLTTPQEVLAQLIADVGFRVDTVLADNSEAVAAKMRAYYADPNARTLSREGLRNALVSMAGNDPEGFAMVMSVPWLGTAGSPLLRDTWAMLQDVAAVGSNPNPWPPVGLNDMVAIAATNKSVDQAAKQTVDTRNAEQQAAQDSAAATKAANTRKRIAIALVLVAVVVLGIVLYRYAKR